MTAVVVVGILFLLVCAGCLVGVLAWLLSNSAQAALKTNLAKFLAKKFGVTLSVTDPTRADKRRSFWAVFIVIVSAVCLALAFVFKEVIMASVLYCAWIDAVSSATRLPPDVVNALTVVLVSLFAFVFLPFVLGAKSGTKSDRKRARLLFAALFLAMFFFVKHFVSQPGSDEYFNSVTGAPMWKYYTSDEGQIVQAPLYKKFNSQDGSLLKLMDPAVAKAHREQEKKLRLKSSQAPPEESKQQSRLPNAHSAQAKEIANALGDNKPFKAEPSIALTAEGECSYTRNTKESWSPLPYGKFEMRVDSVSLTEDRTVIGVVVRLPVGEDARKEFHDFSNIAADGNESEYLVDSNGLIYTIESFGGEYPIALKRAGLYKNLFSSGSEPSGVVDCGFLDRRCAYAMMFFPGEEYHFWLRFPKLQTYWPEFKLGVHHFPPITIKFVE